MKNLPLSCLAFTLVELLVVLAVIGILASLLLPTLTKAKATAQGISCLSNLKQMTLAWTMYGPDHQERVPMNVGFTAQADWETWVRGGMSLDIPLAGWAPPPSDSTNLLHLRNSPLAPYGAVPQIWRCPADRSTRTFDGVRYPRIRSLVINEQLGTYHPYRPVALPPWVTAWMTELMVKTTSAVRNPGPAQCHVFLEAREDSIEDSHFLVHPAGFLEANPALYYLVDFPGNYHNRAGNVSFADGHAQTHRWLDARTQPPLVSDHPIAKTLAGIPSPGNRDVQWIQDRTFQKRN